MPETFDLIVRGGEVVNHAGRGLADVGVRAGKIVEIGDLSQASAGQVFDAKGLAVLPGVIDTQVHFREPGLEWKEDLETGSRAAVMGWRGGRVRNAEHRADDHGPRRPGRQADAGQGPHAHRPRLLCGRDARERPLPWRVGTSARLLRDQGVHGRLHGHPAGFRTTRASSRCCGM
jgi:hypothetical protein